MKSALDMELFLNCVWALVVVAGVCSWLRYGKQPFAARPMSLVALAMLVVILFPVISVSDDLWSLQNPAETTTCQRRDHRAGSPHSIFPAAAALPEQMFAQLSFGKWRVNAPQSIVRVAVDNPAFDSIQNRPPPVA